MLEQIINTMYWVYQNSTTISIDTWLGMIGLTCLLSSIVKSLVKKANIIAKSAKVRIAKWKKSRIEADSNRFYPCKCIQLTTHTFSEQKSKKHEDVVYQQITVYTYKTKSIIQENSYLWNQNDGGAWKKLHLSGMITPNSDYSEKTLNQWYHSLLWNKHAMGKIEIFDCKAPKGKKCNVCKF